ncbi:MAG: ABC transporter substrate-binding protein [Pigmentiphaga sp.]|uniref:ABC transporter substrate-binding protein n=1 Tax=Pigmentiphaga sp. TaxID=1977564 RepID=UPI0029BD6B0F|nr:ABC transporter substrate-binding protein [Pigmentiphaga sp.]MDX3906754.1 ABC transporter substrate-binding protein [Pigmentiphaga sp.]
MSKSSRWPARIAVAAALGIGAAWAAHAQESIVVASYGGLYQDTQREAFFKPFTEATGIKVIEASGISVAKVRSMVQTGNVEWDVFITSTSDFAQLVKANLLEPIDYSKFDPKLLEQLDETAKKSHVLGTQWTSQVLAFSTKAFPGGKHPKNWVDAWDVKAFPGPRILTAGNYAVNPIEVALLSTGEGKDKVYPLNLDKAYAQLEKIRPNVVRWVNSGSAVSQALVDGEAVIGYTNSQRVQQLKDGGAPIDFVWNDGVISMTYWAVPRGAKNKQAAMKFLEFVSRPEQQAAIAKSSIGPVNKAAFALLSKEEVARLPSAPENRKVQLELQPDEWLKPGARGRTIYDENIARWLSFSVKR